MRHEYIDIPLILLYAICQSEFGFFDQVRESGPRPFVCHSLILSPQQLVTLRQTTRPSKKNWTLQRDSNPHSKLRRIVVYPVDVWRVILVRKERLELSRAWFLRPVAVPICMSHKRIIEFDGNPHVLLLLVPDLAFS